MMFIAICNESHKQTDRYTTNPHKHIQRELDLARRQAEKERLARRLAEQKRREMEVCVSEFACVCVCVCVIVCEIAHLQVLIFENN